MGKDPRYANDMTEDDCREAISFFESGGDIKVAALHQHLKVGYNAGARVMEMLVDSGRVSDCDLIGRRTLLVGKDTNPSVGQNVGQESPGDHKS